jgi:glucose/arabinose dehydrogenase
MTLRADPFGRALTWLALAALLPACTPLQPAIPGLELAPPQYPITLPPGFGINVYAGGLQGPHGMAIGPDGHLYVAERDTGRILRLPDRNHDGSADAREVIGDGLSLPTSLAFDRDGSLVVAGASRITRLSRPDVQGFYMKYEILIDNLPSSGRAAPVLRFTPDWSSLLVANVYTPSTEGSAAQDSQHAPILRYNPNGSGEQVYASLSGRVGGIVFRPGTDELWVTGSLRGMPDALYRVRAGEGADCAPGSRSGDAAGCDGALQLIAELPAYSAPLGLAFYTADRFPRSYQGGLFVALHGSWESRRPVGYKIVYLPLWGGQLGPAQDWALGWLIDPPGRSWGRPVDLIAGPDGSLYLTDDSRGFVYRIYYLGDE